MPFLKSFLLHALVQGILVAHEKLILNMLFPLSQEIASMTSSCLLPRCCTYSDGARAMTSLCDNPICRVLWTVLLTFPFMSDLFQTSHPPHPGPPFFPPCPMGEGKSGREEEGLVFLVLKRMCFSNSNVWSDVKRPPNRRLLHETRT